MSTDTPTENLGGRRDAVLERDRHRCQNCARTAAQTSLCVHQIVPSERGGTLQLTNLVTLCRACAEAAATER